MYAWPVLTLESLGVGVDVGWNWQTSVHSECVVVHELGLSGRCWKRSDARDHVMGMLAPFTLDKCYQELLGRRHTPECDCAVGVEALVRTPCPGLQLFQFSLSDRNCLDSSYNPEDWWTCNLLGFKPGRPPDGHLIIVTYAPSSTAQSREHRRPARRRQLLGGSASRELRSFAGGGGWAIKRLCWANEQRQDRRLPTSSLDRKKETGRSVMMAPTGDETYIYGHFTEDDGPFIPALGGSSPPPAYDVAVAERVRRPSASHRLNQNPQTFPAFPTPQYETRDQRNLSSVSPNFAHGGYAAVMPGSGMAEMAGGQGLVYHRVIQRPSPPPSHHSAQSVQVSHNPSTLSSPILNSPAQQSTKSTAPANPNDTWTPEQNRFILRLDKVEGKSLQEISIALEHVFHVERDADTIARQLAFLRARGKAWSDDLSVTENLGSIQQPDSTTTSTDTPTAMNDEQLADVGFAVRLELEQRLRGSLVSDLKQRMFSEQRERNAEYTAMMTMDLGKDSVEDYEIV
ncbi:uncharacterized protein B0T23DRAFT_408362 [Neurospora hispaniola]|uniref:Uncharacterized protein n=1 Tax=Neurospora hispaniola TaxID=588809 RepID=A0AAJ0MLT9_9PEZI|nr:hypothetical protein B0T23DRAFT_408362 [Neurospora hispaniola]